jgi:hypothetical protein
MIDEMFQRDVVVVRPPPHTPPLYVVVVGVTLLAGMPIERPPRKPPWLQHVLATPSPTVLNFNAFILVIVVLTLCLYVCLLYSLFWYMFAYHMFEEVLENEQLHGYYSSTKRLPTAFTNFNILLTTQMSCRYVVQLVISETTHSRFARTPANIFFRSWMNLKTVDLIILLTFDHVWQIFVWLLGFEYWVVAVLLSFGSSMYLTILITCNDLKIWLENVPTHGNFDCSFVILPFE